MDPLLEQFLQEARENLAYIDQHIEDISGDDEELLNALFRAAHTLKGGSGIVGFDAVKDITHSAEDLLDMLRSGKINYQEGMLEALYNAFDEVMNLVEAAEESESIVDADEETLKEIVSQLHDQMGKEEESTAWMPPFENTQDIDAIINLPLPFLENATDKIPFVIGELTPEVCDAPQLYGIFFDVDESCMVYGNDPIYTLSLIQEKVVGIFSCMSETSAKSLISGMDDPDGLELKVQLVAYVYATYAEIEDALFNFIDELVFRVLDISTLLSVSSGDAQKLDVLKELGNSMQPLIDAGDIEAIKSEVDKNLQLLGDETLAYHQLSRLKAVVAMMMPEDMSKLHNFIVAVSDATVYSAATSDNKMVSKTDEMTQESADKMQLTTSSPIAQEQLKEILTQQLRALEVCDDDATLDRVYHLLKSIESHLGKPLPQESVEALKAYLKSELSDENDDDVSAIESAQSEVLAQNDVSTAKTEDTVQTTVESTQEVKSEVMAEEKPAVTAEIKPEVKKEKPKAKAEPAKKSVVGKTVKIEQESIDNLMNIVGELLVAKNSLPYLADGIVDMNKDMIKRAIMEKYTFINRLSEQLQDLIMSMRMLPISYVFDRYPKLVRDISKNLGKKVTLTMDGGDTKLDKNMIEMLADPMIHIMRNSLDHGIEMPDVREQKGKTPNGNVSLRAYAQSDRIIIEIKDDGAGINVDRVINKVLEKGLLTIEQIDAMSDKEKAELVLLPGLSTAEEISEYSGRGVGMDVVKKSIESFGGSISIETQPNQGTTITLAIPVSLAVTSLLHVSMDEIHYGLPMDNVNETVKIKREDIEYLHNEPFVYLRGEVIPLLFISSMLNEDKLEDDVLSIAVLNVKGNLIAVVVNELLGQLDVVQKPLEGVMSHHPIFSGTALLGNGQIIMTIDPLGILSIAHQLKNEPKKAS